MEIQNKRVFFCSVLGICGKFMVSSEFARFQSGRSLSRCFPPKGKGQAGISQGRLALKLSLTVAT